MNTLSTTAPSQDFPKPIDNACRAQNQSSPNPPLRASISSKIITEEIALDHQSRDLLNIDQHQINHGGVLAVDGEISNCSCER